jgi:hypothetical protein
MDAEAFKTWLAGQPMARKSQSNALSKCRRVERLKRIDLDDVVTSPSKIAALFLWLGEHAEEYIQGALPKEGAACLMSAVRTYAEFRHGTKACAASNSH